MNLCPTNISILFTDDAESAQMHYMEFLQQHFKDVYKAGDGQEAWEFYSRHHPDIVLLDIEMPMCDGITLARKIRENDDYTRIIIASGHADQARLLQAVELGLTRFLPKPFGRQMLKEALLKAVDELGSSPVLLLGEGYRWDRTECKLYHGSSVIKLTPYEQALLSLLSSQLNAPLSPYTIETELWPNESLEADVGSRLKTLVKRLRKKLPESCIENIYGAGYKLRLPDHTSKNKIA